MNLVKTITLTCFSLFLSACSWSGFADDGVVMVSSISSSGRYVITTDSAKKAILWDLKKRTHKVVDGDANIYSAYFIKNTNNFMWQHDSNNEVIVEDVNGKIVKKFNPGFASYTQVMTSDLKHYFATDVHWNLYEWSHGKARNIKPSYDTATFLALQTPFHLALTDDNKYLFTAGAGAGNDDPPLSVGYSAKQAKIQAVRNYSLLDGIVLWNVDTAKPIRKYRGPVDQMNATISSDGQYAAGGDIAGSAFVWNVVTGKLLHRLYSLHLGKEVDEPNGKYHFDNKGMILPPENFDKNLSMDSVFAMKFITKQNYLRFTKDTPYAILYNVSDPKPKKYLYLGKEPLPSVYDLPRDMSIDTSPEAHVLVTGKQTKSGIIVYHYNPKIQTLKKVWAPSV